MNILAVGSDPALLSALCGALEQLFPDGMVVRMSDPLLAGKYAFHHRVDLLLAQQEMKRMDGSHLIRFVRQEQPGVRAWLLSPRDGPPVRAAEAALSIPEPVTEAGMTELLRRALPAAIPTRPGSR